MDIGNPRRRFGGLFLFLLVVACFLELTTPSQSPVIPNEALSSPSSITAMKNSAVWLHWNYTYDDGGGLVSFFKQEWVVNDTALDTVTVIAEKTVWNGQIKVSSSLPSSLAGRITASSANNTLMVKNLHYNDTLRQFKSNAFMKMGNIILVNAFPISPSVTLDVKGAPTFLSSPSRSIEVIENGLFSVVTRFDGNPKPTAEAQWSDSSAKQAMTVSEEYPFIYKTEFSASQISSQFCGKTLTIRIQNSVGKAADINIAVTVILTLSNPNLRAGKPNQSCVEVQWQKKESGLCNVAYTVRFKDKSGTVQYTNTEINKSGTTRCGIPLNVNITQVELQMSSTKRNVAFNLDVSEKPIPPPTGAPTTKGIMTSRTTNTISSQPTATTETTATTQNPLIPKTSKAEEQVCTALHIGYSVVIIILTSVIVFLLVDKFRRKKRKNEVIENKSAVGNPKAASNSQIEMHYMELDRHQKAKESDYATLSNPPNESPKDVTYANVAKF